MIPNASTDLVASMARIGQTIGKASGDPSPTRTLKDAFGCCYEFAEYLSSTGNHGPIQALQRPDTAFLQLSSLMWFWSGFPVVEIGHQLAAAICCTKPDSSSVAAMVPPWRCFFLLVPSGLVRGDWFSSGREEDITSVVVLWDEDNRVFDYTAQVGNDQVFLRRGVTVSELAGDEAEVFIDNEDGSAGRGNQGRRADKLLLSMIRGIFILCNDPEKRASYHRSSGASSKAKKASAQKYGSGVSIDKYVVLEPVKIDLRQVLREYMGGTRKSPEVRHLVRGHFKSQRFGSGRASFRTIWVEPYWRGPEAGPIGVKSYKANWRR